MCFAFRGENQEHVILEGGPCYAVHPSDPAVALLALDASVTLVGAGEHAHRAAGRVLPRPDRQDRLGMALAPNELITEITIPAPPPGSRGAYVKVAGRAAWDFALASAAVQLVLDAAWFSRRGSPWAAWPPSPGARWRRNRLLVGKPLAEEAIDAAARGRRRGGQALGAERLQDRPAPGRGAPGAQAGGDALKDAAASYWIEGAAIQSFGGCMAIPSVLR